MLILDEPANGLDPEGMRWMRGLLRDFADRGGTVLLSSHLLYEVEAVADQLVIIGGGRIVAQGSRESLLAGAGTLVRAADPEAACWPRSTPRGCPPRAWTTAASSSTPSPRPSAAPRSRRASPCSHLSPSESAGLEQLFFDLTGDGASAGVMEAVR